MSPRLDHIVVHGTLHVSLEAVARCYDVKLQFIEEVYEHGLLGSGETVDGQVVVAAAELDAAARIVQLYYHTGMNLLGIAVFLGVRR